MFDLILKKNTDNYRHRQCFASLPADPGGSTFTFEKNNSDIKCFEFENIKFTVPRLCIDQCTASDLCTVVNKI